MSRTPPFLRPSPRPSALRVLPVLLALLGSPPNAHAIGLGSPLQNPVIGQPLRIDIPLLLGPGESMPGPDCVRLTPPTDAPDRQFFPRRARAVINASGRPRISIISPDPVAEPLFEFRLSIGCGSSFARDFLVLSDVPANAPPVPAAGRSTSTQGTASSAPTIEAPTASAHEAPPQKSASPRSSVPPRHSPAPPATDLRSDQTLSLSQDTNLNALARQRYPENQATRDEYRRLIAAANPELFAGASRVGSVPLPAGTVLVIPPGLPPQEHGAPPGAAKAEPKPGAAMPNATTPLPDRATPRPVAEPRKKQDRLVIGGDAKGGIPGAPVMSPRELSSAIERMERMIEDQGRTEVEITENLKTLNSAFIELKNYIQTLESKIQQEEKARRALELKAETKPEPKALGILELLALILVGGTAGAGLIVLHHRLTMQRLALNRQATEFPDTYESLDPPHPPDITAFDVPPEPFSAPVEVAIEKPPPAPVKVKPAPAPSPSVAVPPAPTFAPPPAPVSRPAPPVIPAAPAPAPAPEPPPPPAPAPIPVLPPVSSLATVLDTPHYHDPILELPLEFELDLPTQPIATPPKATIAAPVAAAPAAQLVFEPPAETTLQTGHEAVELAEIMASMGLGKEAARSLVEHILSEPKQDLAPWLKAFDIYRETGQRDEFEWLAENLHQHLNVQPQGWDDPYHGDTRSLVDFRHLTKRLVSLWPTPECMDFLEELLLDNREGVRQGFPLTVAEEIVFLQQILRIRD